MIVVGEGTGTSEAHSENQTMNDKWVLSIVLAIEYMETGVQVPMNQISVMETPPWWPLILWWTDLKAGAKLLAFRMQRVQLII